MPTGLVKASLLSATLSLGLLVCIGSAQQQSATPKTITPIKILGSSSNSNQCPSIEERENARAQIESKVRLMLSGNGEGAYDCNGTPGWKQVAFINMTDTSYNCPSGLNLTDYSKRTCGRRNPEPSCSSATFSVGDLSYSAVCGRLIGYQVGATSAFWGYLRGGQSIEGYYIDGVSLTHGAVGQRQHIWTFAAGHEEISGGGVFERCPCDTSNIGVQSPPFVGGDYFCESGINHWNTNVHLGQFIPDDPLWDGQGCSPSSTCCQLNNPPWFTKTLTNPTTDDIELRICSQHVPSFDDTALELIELYVK